MENTVSSFVTNSSIPKELKHKSILEIKHCKTKLSKNDFTDCHSKQISNFFTKKYILLMSMKGQTLI
jgi:hypothetical protein